jgi:hypothetical protein
VQQPKYKAVFFSAATNPDLTRSLLRLRHALFVRELGWALAVENGYERDEFDTDDAVYCALSADGQMIGCFRAISCDRPYLAHTIFSHLATSRPFPMSADYVEISRFGVLAAYRQASAVLYSAIRRRSDCRVSRRRATDPCRCRRNTDSPKALAHCQGAARTDTSHGDKR